MKKFLLISVLFCFILQGCTSDKKVDSGESKIATYTPMQVIETISPTTTPLPTDGVTEYTLFGASYAIDSKCKEEVTDQIHYYYIDDNNIYMVQVVNVDSDTGYEDETNIDDVIDGMESEFGFLINDHNIGKINDDITTLTATGSFVSESVSYKLKVYSFFYNKKFYNFSFIGMTDESLSLLDPVIQSIKILDSVPTTSQQDFLLDKEIAEKYQKYYESCQYKKIYEMANKYIKDNSPLDSDNAYKVVEILKPVVKAISKCNIKKDSVTNNVTIYYKGVKSLSNNIHIVPSIESGADDVTLKVGFTKSGWLFFDTVYLDYGDDYITDTFDSFDMQREVISGSSVMEWIEYDIYDEDIKELESAKKITIRFENSDNGKTMDKKLSGEELSAIKTLAKFSGVNSKLSDLLYNYKN